MSTIIKSAPPCFAHPALLSANTSRGGYQFLAREVPSLAKVFPEAAPIDWDSLAGFGAPTALQVTRDAYVEVRAFRGAFLTGNAENENVSNWWAQGVFAFPAQGRPQLLGVFKNYRQLKWFGDYPDTVIDALQIATVGPQGTLVLFDRSTKSCNETSAAARTWFAACLGMVCSYTKTDDDLTTLFASINKVRQSAAYGARNLFKAIFGAGCVPGRGAPIGFYVPENMTSAYADPVPLQKPDQVTPRFAYIGYDRQRQRFVDLNGS